MLRIHLLQQARVHVRANVEHSFRIIKCQFGLQMVCYRGIRKYDLNLKLLFALSNLWKYESEYLILRSKGFGTVFGSKPSKFRENAS